MVTLRNVFALGAACLFVAATSQGAADWRKQAGIAADHLAQSIEVLDETLHEVDDHHSTPAFKKAIEDIHHIERLVNDLVDDMPAAPYVDLCGDFGHLYHDLVEIRLDLIALGVEAIPSVVRAWNHMANVYNHELLPFFQGCSHQQSWGSDSALELL